MLRSSRSQNTANDWRRARSSGRGASGPTDGAVAPPLRIGSFMRPRLLIGCVLLLAASCYSKPDDEPISCEEKPDPHCGHPIDRILVSKLREVKLAPRDGDASQVCRRLSIDLIGRIPTLAELDACRVQTLAERVDAFM